jgi:hypothetical protein
MFELRTVIENDNGTITVVYPIPDDVEEYDTMGNRKRINIERWNYPDNVGPLTVMTRVSIEKFMLGPIKDK